MTLSRPASRRRSACAAAAVGAVLLLAPASTRGQENRPNVRHSHPVVRLDKRNTRVSFEFNLPTGFTLAERPWIRIATADGKPFVGMRPLFTQRDPLWKGEHDLNTEDFPPGAYRLRVEVDFIDPQGKREMIASPWTPLVVPKR